MTGSQTCWPNIYVTFWYIRHIVLAPVVGKLDNKIFTHWITHNQWRKQLSHVTSSPNTFQWIVIYPIDCIIHLLNN